MGQRKHEEDGGWGQLRPPEGEYSLIGETKTGRLERMAARQRWAIPDASKPEIMARQIEIATGENDIRG